MTMQSALHVGVIAGETSGQLLAADVIAQLKVDVGEGLRLTGVGGDPLAEHGLQTFFDPEEIALMGVTQVVGKLPKLLRLLDTATKRFLDDPPDALLLVDSPDFSSRVAKRLKKENPDLPIAKYVAPTVWAWRPGRAAKMVGNIDHVFALFPFEPDVMRELNGPPTTYVGHRLMSDDALLAVGEARRQKPFSDDAPFRLVLLPGSRRSEIKALLPDMGRVVAELAGMGKPVHVTIPAVARYQTLVRDTVLNWDIEVPVSVVTGRDAQLSALGEADVALAASGTVTLELALACVPTVSIYRVDLLMKPFVSMLTAWSAALPNIIADRVVIPEYYDHMIIPGLIARQLLEIGDTAEPKHRAMISGYNLVRDRMTLKRPAHETVADILRDMVRKPIDISAK